MPLCFYPLFAADNIVVMKISPSERRQIENEMIFRRLNEKIGNSLDELDSMHAEEDNLHLQWNDTVLLNFKCECSDENCDARIPIKLSTYKKVHENRDAFIVKLKHQVNAIERVILSEDAYSVVEKNNSTPEPGDTLNKTSINNT